ncbi:MAG: dihydropteroate synthase [Ignavibacteriales bacterium]|nr:dihydropteroate synthase [Ignavibacteriales bacterium]
MARTSSMWAARSTRPARRPWARRRDWDAWCRSFRRSAGEFPEAIISIDTYKARVAEEAFKAGAHILNDVWALRADPALGSRRGKVQGSRHPDAQPQQPRQRGGPCAVGERLYRFGIR